MKTLIVGHITHDHYHDGFVAGGCAYFGARVHQHLDADTHLATVVGEDFVCDDALQGLDATIVRQGQTTTFANYYPDDGPRVQLLDACAAEVMPSMVDPRWLDADLVHLAPVFGEVDLLRWRQAVGARLLAINVQGWLKDRGPRVDAAHLEAVQRRGVGAASHLVETRRWAVSARELQGVDVACLSEEDLIGQQDLLPRLIDAVPVVALTLGARGSRIYVGGKVHHVGVYPTDVVDPTGAGDTFAAAFTHLLARGADPVEAARFGAAASSLIIEHLGSTGLSCLHELEDRLAQIT